MGLFFYSFRSCIKVGIYCKFKITKQPRAVMRLGKWRTVLFALLLEIYFFHVVRYQSVSVFFGSLLFICFYYDEHFFFQTYTVKDLPFSLMVYTRVRNNDLKVPGKNPLIFL